MVRPERTSAFSISISVTVGAAGTFDVTVTPAGRRRVVRVTVDRALDGLGGTDPVEPLSLDEVADATRAVSDVLDASGRDVLAAYGAAIAGRDYNAVDMSLRMQSAQPCRAEVAHGDGAGRRTQ